MKIIAKVFKDGVRCGSIMKFSAERHIDRRFRYVAKSGVVGHYFANFGDVVENRKAAGMNVRMQA